MRPPEQLEVLGRIWNDDQDGYVFLPWIDADAGEERKKHFHEGRAYHWPRQKNLILRHLENHAGDDLYFSPCLFNGKRRVSELAAVETRLWADLDEVKPTECGEYPPSIAWETSPGRYQGVWLMHNGRQGASWPNHENHRLTAYLGADPSGWDTTQLLRVPGGYNNKPGKDRPRGKLIWNYENRVYKWDEFSTLPEIEAPVDSDEYDLLDEDMLSAIDRHEVWSRVRLKVSRNVREYLRMRAIDSTADRSEIAWQIERDLADAGCTLVEIVAIMRPSVWNKFAGRNDELKRLKIEAAKALASRKEDDGILEEVYEEKKPDAFIDFRQDMVFLHTERPRWLVKDFFVEGACGFISAIPKSLKSWMALDLAFSVSTGADFFQQRVRRTGNVLYIQQEDPMKVVRDRLGKIAEAKGLHWNGRLENVRGQVVWVPPEVPKHGLDIKVMSGFNAGDEGWQAWLADYVAEASIKLVVFDTLATVAPGVDIDRATEVKQKLLDPLKVIGRDNDCAMILVHHNRKASEGGRAGQNMSGSGQIHAWADCGVYINEKRENPMTRVTDLYFDLETKYTGSTKRIFRVDLDGSHDRENAGAGQGLWDPQEQYPDVGQDEPAGERKARERCAERNTQRSNGGAGSDRAQKASELQSRIDELKQKDPAMSVRAIAKAMGISTTTAHKYSVRAGVRD